MTGIHASFRTAFVIACASLVCLYTSISHAEDTAPQSDGNTLDNLQTAYNGESNANAVYLAFAQKADDEGYGKVASLFRAAARAEQVHFERDAMIISDLGGIPTADIKLPPIRSTKENLDAALKEETFESAKMYPAFVEQADKDNIPEAVDTFDDVQKAEAAHAQLYATVLTDLSAWKAPRQDFFVCPVCGMIAEKVPADSCPVCNTPSDQFMTIN